MQRLGRPCSLYVLDNATCFSSFWICVLVVVDSSSLIKMPASKVRRARARVASRWSRGDGGEGLPARQSGLEFLFCRAVLGCAYAEDAVEQDESGLLTALPHGCVQACGPAQKAVRRSKLNPRVLAFSGLRRMGSTQPATAPRSADDLPIRFWGFCASEFAVLLSYDLSSCW